MSKIELGVKRRCVSCSTKFYDFLKTPILCPNCGTEFDPDQLLKSRKGRVATKSVKDEVLKKDKSDNDFESDPLLQGADLEDDIDAVEDDGLPSDEDGFVAVKSDEEEETAPATFDDDEEFIDELPDDNSDEDENEDGDEK
ncbi:TIGR02300 family protein [Alphaproteobacteria bacterium]|nr:TIGR02300 family protein [Alphaproteobacteria bacterium]MDC0461611.1 TIGR02300 family protein [Alphaproteobacteria bacterium]